MRVSSSLCLPWLPDLSSAIIPVDDEEEEEEEAYDDIEGASGPPPVPRSRGGGSDTAADEDNEDIYEVLPGMGSALTHTHTLTRLGAWGGWSLPWPRRGPCAGTVP